MQYFKLTVKLISTILLGLILTMVCGIIYFEFDVGREQIETYVTKDLGFFYWFNLLGYFVWILLTIFSYKVLNRIFNEYSRHDCRKWTVMIEPRIASLYITCYVNRDWDEEQMFELNDGIRFKNLQLKTDSMEVILTKLIDKDIFPSEKNY